MSYFEAYFDNDSISLEEREKWIPQYTRLIEELSKMIKEYEDTTGGRLSGETILNGFQLGKG